MHQQTTFVSPRLSKEEEYFFNLYSQRGLIEESISAFQQIIYQYFHQQGRKFIWRQVISPYWVLVSEIMLQQTQTHRVAQKFDQFVTRFPDVATLAHASFEQVLEAWKGLGYNRRALNLHKISKLLHENFAGILPNSVEALEAFPGIGKATARSVCAFAFNEPTVFIETNIRTVFIYFFFDSHTDIHDNDIMPFINATLDRENPRAWYYALMDYGVMLKKTVGNLCQKSKHYVKQSKFEGSDRQIRSAILSLILHHKNLSRSDLIKRLGNEVDRYARIIDQLCREGLLVDKGEQLVLS